MGQQNEALSSEHNCVRFWFCFSFPFGVENIIYFVFTFVASFEHLRSVACCKGNDSYLLPAYHIILGRRQYIEYVEPGRHGRLLPVTGNNAHRT